MHSPAVYVISVLLFILSGLFLFAAGSSWARVARQRNDANADTRRTFRAAAGLTAAALGLLGAAILWASAIAFLVNV